MSQLQRFLARSLDDIVWIRWRRSEEGIKQEEEVDEEAGSDVIVEGSSDLEDDAIAAQSTRTEKEFNREVTIGKSRDVIWRKEEVVKEGDEEN